MNPPISRVKKRLGCIVTFLSILMLCLTSYLIIREQNEKKLRQDPRSVARAFAISLKTRRLEEALSLVATEKKAELKSWIQEQEQVNCGFSFEVFEDDFYRIGLISEGETTVYYEYESGNACPNREAWRRFIVQDIVVERQQEGWVVVDWGEVEESLD